MTFRIQNLGSKCVHFDGGIAVPMPSWRTKLENICALYTYIYIYFFMCITIYVFMYHSIHVSIYLYLSICLPAYLSIYLKNHEFTLIPHFQSFIELWLPTLGCPLPHCGHSPRPAQGLSAQDVDPLLSSFPFQALTLDSKDLPVKILSLCYIGSGTLCWVAPTCVCLSVGLGSELRSGTPSSQHHLVPSTLPT